MIGHPEPVTYMAVTLGYLVGQVEILATRLRSYGEDHAATSADMAQAMLGETLLRLGVPTPGQPDHGEDGPLVLGVDVGVCPDEGLGGRSRLRSVG